MASTLVDRLNGVNGGAAVKKPVALATTANITLSGEQTIDGTLTSSSDVLVKDQSDATKNGIYITSSGAWTRRVDANGVRDLVVGSLVFVTGGTVNGSKFWSLGASGNPIVLGATAITFTDFSSFIVPANLLEVNLSSPSSGEHITYDGTDWVNSALAFASQAEAEAGIATDKPLNALRTAQAIDALSPALTALGRVVNVQGFSSSVTYTKHASASQAIVICAGGGGGGGGGLSGAGGAGGASSFAAFCSASGGSGGLSGQVDFARRASDGTGSGGNIVNVPAGGGKGGSGYADFRGADGYALGQDGGIGGLSVEFITTGLGATETVTVGAAGSAGGTGSTAGKSGFVIVVELE